MWREATRLVSESEGGRGGGEDSVGDSENWYWIDPVSWNLSMT
jgi:hypothetical protein